jgi:hypothetical protein
VAQDFEAFHNGVTIDGVPLDFCTMQSFGYIQTFQRNTLTAFILPMGLLFIPQVIYVHGKPSQNDGAGKFTSLPLKNPSPSAGFNPLKTKLI